MRTEIKDSAAEVRSVSSDTLAAGFQAYERHEAIIAEPGTEKATTIKVDVLRAGAVVGVLPIDVVAQRVVLIRQFRYAAHLATGRGMLVEIVAGRVEPGEDPKTAAARECFEEIGVAPSRLISLYRSMPSPGITDEIATLYVAFVDSASIAAAGGLAVEQESTHPFHATFDEAIAALDDGTVVNSFLIQSLQWLAINRTKLPMLAIETTK